MIDYDPREDQQPMKVLLCGQKGCWTQQDIRTMHPMAVGGLTGMTRFCTPCFNCYIEEFHDGKVF